MLKARAVPGPGRNFGPLVVSPAGNIAIGMNAEFPLTNTWVEYIIVYPDSGLNDVEGFSIYPSLEIGTKGVINIDDIRLVFIQ